MITNDENWVHFFSTPFLRSMKSDLIKIRICGGQMRDFIRPLNLKTISSVLVFESCTHLRIAGLTEILKLLSRHIYKMKWWPDQSSSKFPPDISQSDLEPKLNGAAWKYLGGWRELGTEKCEITASSFFSSLFLNLFKWTAFLFDLGQKKTAKLFECLLSLLNRYHVLTLGEEGVDE